MHLLLHSHRGHIFCRSEKILNCMRKRPPELSAPQHSCQLYVRLSRNNHVPHFSCTIGQWARCYYVIRNRAYCVYCDSNCVRFIRDVPGIEKRCLQTLAADGHDRRLRKKKPYYLWIVSLILAGTAALLDGGLRAEEEAEVEESSGCETTNIDTLPQRTADQEGHRIGKSSLADHVAECRGLVQKAMEKIGCPGMSVAVSVNGKTVWAEGFGHADLENDVPCTPESVFRIASISKPITMAAVAKLWEEGKLDLDKPVQHYVPEFPEKTWKGEKVSITTRQLVTHRSGIRHYDKTYMTEKRHKNVQEILKRHCVSGNRPIQKIEPLRDPDLYNRRLYNSVFEALDVFKDDPLYCKPGTQYYYSSFSWILVSAVVEKVAGIPFEASMRTVFDDLGLKNTHFEKAAPLIYHRGRHYDKGSRKACHKNSPYIDVSHKWAAEGILSDVLDLIKFGNAMLYSYQTDTCQAKVDHSSLTHNPGYLKHDTMQQLWTDTMSIEDHKKQGTRRCGMGWLLRYQKSETGDESQKVIYHLGGAVGATSILLILPSQTEEHHQSRISKDISSQTEERNQRGISKDGWGEPERVPSGVVVSMITNIDSDYVTKGLYPYAIKIANTFAD